MKYIAFLICALVATQSVSAVCQKCVRIRAENEEKGKNQTWVFYEDWLDSDEGQTQSDISFDKEEEQVGDLAPKKQ